MAKYRVLETSFIDNGIVQAGAEIEYDGEAGSNLELIEDEPAKPTKGKAEKSESGKDLV